MGNINEDENEGTRIMRLKFEEILQTLTAFTKENIEERERQIKLKKLVAETEVDRTSKILERYLDNTNNIFIVVDAGYAMGWKKKERKGLKLNEKRK